MNPGDVPDPAGDTGSGELPTPGSCTDVQCDHSTPRRAVRRRLAPFGRNIVARVDAARRRGTFHGIAPCSLDGRFADVIAYCGPDGMRRAARCTRLRLALPYGDDPSLYRWPVRDLACAIIWADEHDRPPDGAVILALGQELTAGGAHIVLDVATGGRLDHG